MVSLLRLNRVSCEPKMRTPDSSRNNLRMVLVETFHISATSKTQSESPMRIWEQVHKPERRG